MDGGHSRRRGPGGSVARGRAWAEVQTGGGGGVRRGDTRPGAGHWARSDAGPRLFVGARARRQAGAGAAARVSAHTDTDMLNTQGRG